MDKEKKVNPEDLVEVPVEELPKLKQIFIPRQRRSPENDGEE